MEKSLDQFIEIMITNFISHQDTRKGISFRPFMNHSVPAIPPDQYMDIIILNFMTRILLDANVPLLDVS